jgi:enamine deaminase RidA (YjgF/YER057c/UK114 family)
VSGGDAPAPVEPPGWPRPKGYSNGMVAPAGARLLAIAGQVAWDAHQKIVSDDFAAQFEQALANVCRVVETAGGCPEHLIRLVFFVTDKAEYERRTAEIGERYRKLLGRHFPACTLVEVKGLLEPGARIEIEATAALPPR